jgi:hypothetical protein
MELDQAFRDEDRKNGADYWYLLTNSKNKARI